MWCLSRSQERINLSEQLIAKLELQMALLSAAVTAASVRILKPDQIQVLNLGV